MIKKEQKHEKIPGWLQKVGIAVAYTVWVAGAFFAASIIVDQVLLALINLGVPLGQLNQVIFATVYSVMVYGLALWAVIWIPKRLLRKTTDRKDLGVSRLPSWMDIMLAPAVFLPYFLLSSGLLMLATAVFPAIDVNQKQELGFSTSIFGSELALAFVVLVVVAPLVEETLFRGYLYGKLRPKIGHIGSMLLVSLCFAVLHGQANVGIDVFALSIVLCLLREYTGSIWAGVLLHALKNGLAFYLLFINPSLLSTMGG